MHWLPTACTPDTSRQGIGHELYPFFIIDVRPCMYANKGARPRFEILARGVRPPVTVDIIGISTRRLGNTVDMSSPVSRPTTLSAQPAASQSVRPRNYDKTQTNSAKEKKPQIIGEKVTQTFRYMLNLEF